VSSHLSFIRPLSPSASARPPQGDDWSHKPKWVGFSFQVIKDGVRIRFYWRRGAECTDRLPRKVGAFGKLPTRSAVLDGEKCLVDLRGAARFWSPIWCHCARRTVSGSKASGRSGAIGLRQRIEPLTCPDWKRANSKRWRVFEKTDAR
jgi:hypothetical protein